MKKVLWALVCLTLLLVFSCGGSSSNPPGASSSSKAITVYSFLNPSAIGNINESGKTIAITVPYGMDVTALVATFTTTGASVKVGGTVQVSGTTPNNFTNPVLYTVTAADGSTAEYTVTVIIALNSAKSITSFTLLGIPGTINESAKTVSLSVPYGTDVTALVATFTTTGASVKVGGTVQVSGTTPNNFTNPVLYTVTAADGSTAEYTVTVSTATLLSIDLSPRDSIVPAGTSQQLMATGVCSDSSIQNLTSFLIWSSSNSAVATISNSQGAKGQATAVAIGSTIITATDLVSGVTSSTTLIVSPETVNASQITDQIVSLNASFNNSGGTTTVWFEYGSSSSYGFSTSTSAYAQSGQVNVSVPVSGLSELTTYHYRIVGQNSSGMFYSSDQIFKTLKTPQLLAETNGYAKDLAIDLSYAYWIESSFIGQGKINKVGLNGGPVTSVISGLTQPIAMITDASTIYWIDFGTGNFDGTVNKISKNGGAVTTLATGLNSPGSTVAFDGNFIYWIEGSINKVSINGGPILSVVSDMLISSITVDDTYVYWTTTNPDAVKKINKNGGIATTLASVGASSQPTDIVADSTNVYWVEVPSASGGALKKVSVNGGSVSSLADGLWHSSNVILDSGDIYWTDASSSIKKIGVNGGVIVVLAAGINPTSIAIDSSSIYWSEYSSSTGTGAINKIPKSY